VGAETVLLAASSDGTLSRIRLAVPPSGVGLGEGTEARRRLRRVACTRRARAHAALHPTPRARALQVLDDDGSGACRAWATPGRGECAGLDVSPALDVAACTSGGQLALLSLAQPGSQVGRA
jgi:hypothetical protein